MDQSISPEQLQQILSALEINLGEKEQAALREHLQSTLEKRVGLALVDLLSDDEVKELLKLTEAGDRQATENWLDQHAPDYKQVVQDEIDILLGDLADGSEKI